MSIFDTDNTRLDLRILHDGTVWLEQATRYFYYDDSDPITHLSGKTGYKWDEVFDGANALPTQITVGVDDLVGAVPIQVLNEFLATGTIDFANQGITLPTGAVFPTFTFSGGDVHSWNYVTSGLTSTNGSHTVPADIDLDQIWIDGNDVWPLEDSLEALSSDLLKYWDQGHSDQDLVDLGDTIDRVIKADLETQISNVRALEGGKTDTYYALIELDPSAGMEAQDQAIYIHSWETWVKPVAFDTALELRNYLLDQNGHAIEGIFDIGVFLSDTITTATALETELAKYHGVMDAQAQDDFYSNAYTFSRMDLWNDFSFVDVADAYTAAGYDIVANGYPAGIDLDIYNVNTVKLTAGTSPDTMINGLRLSNNNDITLEVYLASAAPATADFSSFTTAHTVVLSAADATPHITLDNLNFGASQTVVLENTANSGTVNASFSTYNGTKVAPAKIIVGEGVNLGVTLDNSANAPEIVNQGGTVDFTGDSSGNYIVGTDGADIIEGMGGDDVLTGGKGADTFVIEQDETDGGNVTITDFDSNDTITLLKSDGSTAMTETYDKDAATTTAGVYFKEENSDTDEITYSFMGGSVTAKDVSDPIYDVPFDFGNDNKFEIYEIPGERYGNIVTFGVRPKGEFIDTEFSQIDFGVTFDTAEFEYFADSFEIGSQTKAATDASSTKLLEVNDASGAEGRLSFGAGVDGATLPMAYDAHVGWTVGEGQTTADKPDDYIAKFMLKRIDQNPGNNDLQILFADHATWDATNGVDVVFDNVTPENFTFNYAKDIVTVKMTNPVGTVAPGSELFVSTATVSDGLSLIPTMQIEDLVKYEVVLNVSVPTVRSLTDSATAPTNANLKISGAEIFDVSVEADLEDGMGSPTMFKNLDDGGAETLTSGTAGQDAFINAISALGDTRTDLVDPNWASIDSSESLELSFAGLTEQTGVGRFKVAEFWARQDDSGIQYSYSNDGGTTYSDEITMKAEELSSVGTLRTVVNDGADVALLGNSVYVNPFHSYRAITGYDALQALRISVDDETDPSYSLESFVAADFDYSGTVTASDALGILETAAYVDEDERSTDGSPMWTYIQTNVDGDYVTLGRDASSAITVKYDNDIDKFIGVNTHIEAVAVLQGDTSNSYKYLPEVIDPLFYFLDGFINTGADVGGTSDTTPDTPATPVVVTYSSGTATAGDGSVKIDHAVAGNTSGFIDYITGASALDTAAFEVVGITTNAAPDWGDVNTKIGDALSIVSDMTGGNAATTVIISNGTDARGYTFKDDGVANSTVEGAELTHAFTISGLTDVTSLDAADFSLQAAGAAPAVTSYTGAVTSSAENHDLGGGDLRLVFDSATNARGDTVLNFDKGNDKITVTLGAVPEALNVVVIDTTDKDGTLTALGESGGDWVGQTTNLNIAIINLTDGATNTEGNKPQVIAIDADKSGSFNASDYLFEVSNFGTLLAQGDITLTGGPIEFIS